MLYFRLARGINLTLTCSLIFRTNFIPNHRRVQKSHHERTMNFASDFDVTLHKLPLCR